MGSIGADHGKRREGHGRGGGVSDGLHLTTMNTSGSTDDDTWSFGGRRDASSGRVGKGRPRRRCVGQGAAPRTGLLRLGLAGSGRRATLAESRWLRATGRWPPTARASRACCRARWASRRLAAPRTRSGSRASLGSSSGKGLSHGCGTAAHREQGPRGSPPGPWPARAAGRARGCAHGRGGGAPTARARMRRGVRGGRAVHRRLDERLRARASWAWRRLGRTRGEGRRRRWWGPLASERRQEWR
uniref:Uncharacterized protein n=1 Tax=Zea mays TaxID=4577 RepID=A0A804RJB6_MAIZE